MITSPPSTKPTWNISKGIWHKTQHYTYSCFSACLQTAMKNMFIGGTIKNFEVENDFRMEFMKYEKADLATTAPRRSFISVFLWNYDRLLGFGSNMILITSQQDDVLEIVTRSLTKEYCAIIGFIDNNSGHALMALKTPKGSFFVNPSTPEVELIEEGFKVELVNDGKGFKALRFEECCAMQFAYILYY